jgi:hypothetical protein
MGYFRSGWTALWLIVGASAVLLAKPAHGQEMEPTTQAFPADEVSDSDCGCNLDPECCLANWHVSADAIFLGRSTPGGGAIFATNPGLAPMASGSDFDFGWDAGIDFAVTRRLANGNSLQVRFFTLDSVANDTFVTPGNFIGGGFTGPGGTTIVGRYVTSLDNNEINWRHVWSERITWLVGFRWIELQDDLMYRIGPVARGEYNYRNHMYGGQVGLDWLVLEGCGPWEVNAIGKLGLFGNFTEGGIYEFGPGPIGTFNTTESGTSFVAELGITGTYHVTEQCGLRIGYEFLFLNNLGLASDAASTSITNPSLLAANVYRGDVFYHGLTAGVEYAW